jgi:hypothetical protein
VLVLAAMLAIFLTLASPDTSLAAGWEVTGLQVFEGDAWRARNYFFVDWDADESRSRGPVEYAVRTVTGEPIPGYETGATWEAGAGVEVPPVPGVYSFEAWRQKGNRARVYLYFDNSRPAPVTVTAPAWVAAGEDVPVRLSHPDPPLPISGLAGYAVSMDPQQDASPCAEGWRCRSAELDLAGGVDDDTIAIDSPPEGVSFVHAVAVSDTGMASTAVGSARVAIDGTAPQVRLEGVSPGWASGPVRLTAAATDPLSGMAASGPGGPVTVLTVDAGPALVVPGPTAKATVGGEGVHTVRFYGRDAVGNSGDGTLPFAGPGVASVRIDETGPSVRFLPPDPTDPERIEATVVDRLAGPDPDRGSIEVRHVGASRRFDALPTTVRAGRLIARWSSDDYPRGAYEFRATGFDAAGNSTTSALGEDGAPLVLRNPVKREVRLAFGFGAAALVFQHCSRADGSRRCHRAVVHSYARRPAARTVPCCHGAVVGGLLLGADDQPLSGQAVEVVETFPRGSHNRIRRTGLTTDADGRFSTRLAAGPSREIAAEFPGTHLLTRAGGRPLRLRVRAAVHLRASTARVRVGGPPVVFSGRVVHPEASLPASGLAVQLEFRLPEMAWTQFRTVQTDSAGRFRFPYAFSDDDSADVRFLFRAFVPPTGDWPFAPATSRPVAVTG